MEVPDALLPDIRDHPINFDGSTLVSTKSAFLLKRNLPFQGCALHGLRPLGFLWSGLPELLPSVGQGW